MAIRSRDRKRAEAHRKVVAGLRSIQGAAQKVNGPTTRKPTAQELAFAALVRSGVPANEARAEAGLPPIK